MNELRELESGIERLKRDSQSKKTMIAALESEKAELIKRSEELSERLRQTNESQKESYRKLTELVNSQVTQLRMELAELSNSLKMVSGLEERLETQEKAHEKSLSKLEKELALVEKALSDVEGVKSELSRQRAFFQEARLQLDKSLQSGISGIRKEMDSNRKEDARAALDEFRQEIERIASIENELAAQKRSHESRVDGMVEELSSLKSALAELRILRERSKSLEELGKDLDERTSELSNRQKTASAVLASEMSKQLENGIASLRKDFDSRRSEDSKAQLKEFRQELKRIASLDEGLRESEKRIDRLAEGLSGLQPVFEQVAQLREEIQEALHMNQSLADRTVSASDFERAVRSTSKRMEELENRLFSLDKKLSSDRGSLEKAIHEVLGDEKILEHTQENIKQWFDAKHQDLEKRVASGIDALTTQMEEGAALVDHLRTKSQKLDLMTKEVPRKIDEHDKTITRLLDARGSLAASLESLSGDIRTISGNLSSSLQRIASLEKGLSSVDKGKEGKIDSLARELSAYQENMGKLSSSLSSSLERIASLEKSLSSVDKGKESRIFKLAEQIADYRDELGKLSEEFSASTERISSLEKSLSSVDKSRIGGLERELSAFKESMGKISSSLSASLERIAGLEKSLSSVDKGKESRIDRLANDFSAYQQELKNLSVLIKESSDKGMLDMANLRAELGATLKDMTKELDSKVAEAADSGLEELREKTRGLASMKDLESEVKALKSGMTQLAKVREFVSEIGEIKSRLSAMDSRNTSFSESLAKEFGEFKKSMESRLSGISEEQAGQFKKEFDYIAKNIDSIRDISSDIKIFRSKLTEIERFSRTKLSVQDFEQFREYIESKLSETDGIILKSLERVAKDLDAFKERVESGKLSHKDFSKSMELIDAKIDDVGKLAAASSDELRKDLDSLKKSFSERMSDAKGTQLKDFKDELRRVSQLEKDMGTYARTHEKRLDQLSEGLSSLQSMPPEIGMLREKIDSLEKLSGSLVHDRDLSARLKEINSAVGQLQAGLAGLSDRLHSQEADMEAAIQEALGEDRLLKKSQAAMNRLIDSRLEGLDKKISANIRELSRAFSQNSEFVSSLKERISDIKAVSGKSAENAAVLDKLRQRLDSLEASFKSVSSRLSLLDKVTDRLSGLEPLAGETETLKSGLDALSKELSGQSGRISALEKGIASNGKSKEARIDELSKRVEAMDTKLDSGREEFGDFREYIVEHVNDIINSYEKRFGELSKDLSGKQVGSIEKTVTELQHLKTKVSDLESIAKALSEKAVPEKEFVDTVKSISKRIDGIESLYSDVDKKTSLHEADLDKAVQKALSSDKLIQVNQKHMQEWLESRIADMEKRLSGDFSSQASRLSAGLEELSSMKGEIARLKAISEHIDEEAVSRMDDSISEFSKSRQGIEDRLDSLTGELKSMSDRLIEEKGRINSLDQKLKSSMDIRDAKIRDMIKTQKADLTADVSDEISKIVRDAEVGEARRKQEFENLLMKFQDLHIKTQKNLDAITTQRENFIDMERKLSDRMDKQVAATQSRLASDQERIADRVDSFEKLVMKLNNMVSGLQIKLDDKKGMGSQLERILTELREDVNHRMKANEDMFDSEMDAFKRRVDTLAARLEKGSTKSEDSRTRDMEKLLMKFQDLHSRTQQNLDSIVRERDSLSDIERKLRSGDTESQGAVLHSRLLADYDRLKQRLADSESLIAKLNGMISGLQSRLESREGVKEGVDRELADMKDDISERMKTMDNLIREISVWKDVQKNNIQGLPAADRKDIEALTKSITGLESQLKSGKSEMKKFKEYVIEYINDLVNTYENRMGKLKNDIEDKIIDARKPRK